VIAENVPQNDGPTEPRLLNVRDVARCLRMSVRATWRANAAGFLPRPLKIGKATRWRESEISQWMQCGAPPRDVWEQRRAAQTVGDKST